MIRFLVYAFFAQILFSAAYADYLPLPILRAEYTQVRDRCLEGIAPDNTMFPSLYEDYCGCVAQEVIGATKAHPEWLRDSKFNKQIQPIVRQAFEFCDQYWDWKMKNAVPYVKPKKIE